MIENLAALLLVAALEVQNSPACGARVAVVARLQSEYHEVLVNQGVAGPTHVMEIFASPSGSWSLLLSSTTEKTTCFIATGKGWKVVDPKKEGKVL